MDPVERLVAIEAIRSLKARYCIAVDTRDADRLASVLATDAVADFQGARMVRASGSGTPGRGLLFEPLRGREVIVAAIMKAVAPRVTVHHCSLGDIEIESADRAKATWPIVDRLSAVESSGSPERIGYGYYHETYVTEDGDWRIATIAMSRLRLDETASA